MLPQLHAPSPMYPTRTALSSDRTVFRCGKLGTETLHNFTVEGPGGSKGNGVACGSTATPLGRFFGYFLIGIRKYRLRQGENKIPGRISCRVNDCIYAR